MGVRIEGRFQDRVRHATGIVGDRRRRDHRDDFKKMVLAETGGKKRIDIAWCEAAARLDQPARQPGQGRGLRIGR